MRIYFIGFLVFVLLLSSLALTSFANEPKKDIAKTSGAEIFHDMLNTSPEKYKTVASLWELRANAAVVKLELLKKKWKISIKEQKPMKTNQ